MPNIESVHCHNTVNGITMGHAYEDKKDPKESTRCMWVLIVTELFNILLMILVQGNLRVKTGASNILI